MRPSRVEATIRILLHATPEASISHPSPPLLAGDWQQGMEAFVYFILSSHGHDDLAVWPRTSWHASAATAQGELALGSGLNWDHQIWGARQNFFLGLVSQEAKPQTLQGLM